MYPTGQRSGVLSQLPDFGCCCISNVALHALHCSSSISSRLMHSDVTAPILTHSRALMPAGKGAQQYGAPLWASPDSGLVRSGEAICPRVGGSRYGLETPSPSGMVEDSEAGGCPAAQQFTGLSHCPSNTTYVKQAYQLQQRLTTLRNVGELDRANLKEATLVGTCISMQATLVEQQGRNGKSICLMPCSG